MVVCKFFLQGHCRFGENCRNEHPRSDTGGGFGSQNRFGALSGNNRFGGDNRGSARKDTWQFTLEEVSNDLAAGKGRPKWILSSYGLGKNPPASLLPDNEYSPEEVRARFYELAAEGKQDDADREAITLWNKAEQEINQLVNNARDAENLTRAAAKKHPNREDLTQVDGTRSRDEINKEAEQSSTNMAGGFGSNVSPFGSANTSTFGQPSQSPFSNPAAGSQGGFGGASPSGGAFGQAPNGGSFGSSTTGFGKPAFGRSGFGSSGFGQPAQPTSAFGQPSQPTSTFGQPAKPTSSGFGQPSQPSSGFGQPAFGSTGFGSSAPKNPFAPATAASAGLGQSTSTFGQPSQPSSGFGQPSQPAPAFGQPSQPTSSFGQPSQPTSTFGQPSKPAASGFGQPTQASPSPFGESVSSARNWVGSNTSPFGQPEPASGFGSSSAPAFGQTGFGSGTTPGFGQPSAPANPFVPQPAIEAPLNEHDMDTAIPATPGSQPQPRTNPFGTPLQAPTPAPAQALAPNTTASPFGGAPNTSSMPHALTDKPRPLSYTQTLPSGPTRKDPSGRLTTYRGQPVSYMKGVPCYRRPDNREFEKIWFPDGDASVDIAALNKEDKIADCQGEEDEYTQDVIAEFKHLFETGGFKDGTMPVVPPLRAWAQYDF